MSKQVKTGTFDASELVKVPPRNRPVVIRSGGPIMDLVCIEGNKGVCEWEYDGKTERHLFLLGILFQCSPIEETPPDAPPDDPE